MSDFCRCRNPSADENLRHLERLVAQGDQDAVPKLISVRSRLGLCCDFTGWSAPYQRCACQMTPSEKEADSWLPTPVDRIDTPFNQEDLTRQRERWLAIGLATGPTDRELAQAGIIIAYREVGLPPPQEWIWLGNPRDGALEAGKIMSRSADRRVEKTDRSCSYEINNLPIWEQVRSRTSNQVRSSTWEQVEVPVDSQIRHQLAVPVRDKINNAAIRTADACYGSHDAGWLSYYEIFSMFGLHAVDVVRGHIWTAQACGWWWPFEKTVIVTDRPSLITDQEIIYGDHEWVVEL